MKSISALVIGKQWDIVIQRLLHQSFNKMLSKRGEKRNPQKPEMPAADPRSGSLFRPLLHFVQKLASNDNFDIVFRQVENLEAHIFKISVSICLAKHSPHFVIESLHGGIG